MRQRFLFNRQSHMVAAMTICTRKTYLLLLVIASGWLAGCERHVRVESAWQDGVARNQSFTKILVVGVSPDVNVRCDFESFMATQLRSEYVAAKSSCSLMPINDPLTVEAIEEVVAAEQVDAVLATILVASNAGAKYGGMNETRGSGDYKAIGTGYGYGYGYYGGYGMYGVPVTYVEFQTTAPITTVSGAVQIVSRLYETGAGAMVYELTTTAHDLQSRDQALAAIAAPIAGRMRRDGLIR